MPIHVKESYIVAAKELADCYKEIQLEHEHGDDDAGAMREYNLLALTCTMVLNRGAAFGNASLLKRFEQCEAYMPPDIVDSFHFQQIRERLRAMGMVPGDLCSCAGTPSRRPALTPVGGTNASCYRYNQGHAMSIEIELGLGNVLLRGSLTNDGRHAGLRDTYLQIYEKLELAFEGLPADLPAAKDLMLSFTSADSPLRLTFVVDLTANDPVGAAQLPPLTLARRVTTRDSVRATLARPHARVTLESLLCRCRRELIWAGQACRPTPATLRPAAARRRTTCFKCSTHRRRRRSYSARALGWARTRLGFLR